MTLALRSSSQYVLAAAMAAAVALCCMLSFAPHAQAATLSSDQLANVQQLLQSYGVDSQQITAVTSVLQDAANQLDDAQQMLASSSPCAAPLHPLARGMSGQDVTTLQQRLVDDGYLTEDNATGFFGSTTLAALQAWQADQGIVATGTPATTGWGSVGQRTLAALQNCQTRIGQRITNVEQRAASTTQRLDNLDNRLASTTQRIDNRMGSSTLPVPSFPGFTPGPQSSAAQVGQFLSDYSDSFNQNMAAVATAPYNFYVPMLSDFFLAIGLN